MSKRILLLIFSLVIILPSVYALARTNKSEKSVSISLEWSRIQSHGSNQLAIWVEDAEGNYITTIFATKFTAAGGYIERPVSLSDWVAKSGFKNASREEVDAISGSTPLSGLQTYAWDCRDKSGQLVPKGIYVIRMEANIQNDKKMFFKGEIPLGGRKKKTAGEITYSDPELATGNVLFKNVLVEYK